MSILPYDRQAEADALGCMILHPDNLIEGCKQLTVEDFTLDSTREIYTSISDMFNNAIPIDETTLAARISEHNRRPLRQLVDGAKDANYFGDYLTILHDRRARREIRNAIEEVVAEVNENSNATSVLETLERYAFKLRSKHTGKTRENRHTTSQMQAWFDSYLSDEWVDDGEYSFDHVMPTLQQRLGKFGRGELGVIAGYSGDGKSVYGLQQTAALCMQGLKIGYYSLEMPERQILRRLAAHTGVSVKKIKDRSWNSSEREILRQRAILMAGWDLDIHSGSVSVEQVRADQMKYDYDVIIIDHLHRMSGSSDRLKLEETVRGFKTLALDSNSGVLLLAQLSRRDGYPPPTTNQLRGTEMITAEADWVLFVYRKRNELMQRTTESEIIVGKVRDGEADIIVPCVFSQDSMLFVEDNMIHRVSLDRDSIASAARLDAPYSTEEVV